MVFLTKLLTVVLALIEGLGIFLSYKSSGIFIGEGFLTGFMVVLSLMTGTALLMWLGEQITTKGIGNGISINSEKQTNPDLLITEDLFKDNSLVISKGKKTHIKVNLVK